ncbi:sulfatase-like hydrolase/transferase [Franconibacter helveticus 513]|uniref:sulfatase-like hydrolase/transferase n=1 Tax=Franconibacter helveticus TaxID=357240 RepID=UPI000410D598|nr:sulfatase-like hydrolase/transferase [Franconibacter helveticus]
MSVTTLTTPLSGRSNLLRTLGLTLAFMLLFSLSEISILLKDHVYHPKHDDVLLYAIISLLAAASARFFLTRLLLAVTFIVQISEAIYYTFYGQFYGPSEVWLAFVETKDIASGISDSFGTLGIYFIFMLAAVIFSLGFARRFAPAWKKWLAMPCLLAIVVMFAGQFYKAIDGQMYKFNPDLRHSLLRNGLSAMSFSSVRLIPEAISGENQNIAHYDPYSVTPVPGYQSGKYSIILAIGESLNPHHVSAVGYERETTPELAALMKQYQGTSRIIVSNAVSTRVAIPMLVNNLREPDNYFAYKSKSTNLFANAQKQGYQTAFISAQGLEGLSNWIGIHNINFWEDTQIRPAPEVGADSVLTPSVETAKIDYAKPFFMVLNSRAPHIPYERNIPAGFAKFSTPKLADDIAQKKNEYDDAVRLYDKELASAIRTVMAKSKLPVLVFITSDHGERVGDGGLFGHSVVEMPIAQVPFIYFSNGADYRFDEIASAQPKNHFQLATLINKMLGFDVTNPNQKDDSYFITGGDIRGLSERITYHLDSLPENKR